MKTIFVHIGTPKTATTHLQHYFARNRARLLDDGVYYVTDRQGLTAQGVAVALGFWEDHDQNAYSENIQWFREELGRAAASPAGRILLSTEMFCVTLPHRRKTLIKRLHDELKAAGAQRIIVVCYLRRQDLFVESWWSNDIARWGILPPVSEADPDALSYIDYYELLSDYQDVFGDAIVVRPFEKSQLVGGDIVDDFHDVLGVPRHDGYVLPDGREHNARMRGDLLELVRQYNCSTLGEKRDYGFMSEHFLPALFTPEQLGARAGERFLRLPKAKRQAILNRYAASNRRVARQFLGRKDGRLFRDPGPAEPADAGRGASLQLDEFTPLFMHMVTGNFARGVQLRQRVDEVERAAAARAQEIDRAIEKRSGAVQSQVAELQADLARVRTQLEEQLQRTEDRCRDLEWRLACRSLTGKKLVGWGTSRAFRENHFKNPAALDYVVDNDSAKWGRRIKGISIQNPGRLESEVPGETVVIVYSNAFEQISAQIAALGNFTVIPSDVFVKYAPVASSTAERGNSPAARRGGGWPGVAVVNG